MKEILITSSVLILALLLLRRLFRNTIPRRVQYALWGLVLLRLLLPAGLLPKSDISVLTTVDPVVRRMESQPISIDPVRNTVTAPAPIAPDTAVPADPQPVMAGPAAQDNTHTFTDGDHVTHAVAYKRQISLTELLRLVWGAGAALAACWFLYTNLRFWRRLCRGRTPFPVENCKRTVWLVEEGLSSPCLFGLFRPAIYLTPAAAASPDTLRHVLAHEETHARHLDPLWSLMRGVCLTVYWFDPLVWWAAMASRNDCELACDEGVLRRLGEGERIAYGRTLLALIPVRKAPTDPLLSATTMTSGKRQLKERITRIAEHPRTAVAALLAVVAVAAAVCAVTFTAASGRPKEEVRPLTAEELRYFNEEFFNDMDDSGLSIHNLFLDSFYDQPEDIDLWTVFRSLGSEPDGNLESAFFGHSYRTVPASYVDDVLTRNIGLTLEETNRVGMGTTYYLANQDTYHLLTGKTSTKHITFTAGEREGDLVRLYYDSSSGYPYGYQYSGQACVTLRETEDGGWWFVSNQRCEPFAAPAFPALPEGEAVLTIPLEGTPYQPPEVTVQPYTGEYQEVRVWPIPDSEYSIMVWRGTDGDIYYGTQRSVLSSLPETYFLRVDYDAGPERLGSGTFRNEILGEGLVLTYPVMMGTTMHAYYSFDKTGTPTLLFQTTSEVQETDWQGSMLIWEPLGAEQPGHHLLYRRDGQLYEADIPALLQAAWPELLSLDYSEWDSYRLYVYGSVELPGSGGRWAEAPRQIYLDGDSLLVYPVLQTFEDHIAADIEAPGDVLKGARAFVQEVFQVSEQGFILQENGDFLAVPVEYDDWRVESLGGPWYELVGETSIEIWSLAYALHTTTPDRVSLAGSRAITEDCWVSSRYPDIYLFFQMDGGSSRTFLYGDVLGGGVPGTDTFRAKMLQELSFLGIVSAKDVPNYADHMSTYIDAPSDVRAAAKAHIQELFERIQRAMDNPSADVHPQEGYDDWRVESLTGPWQEEIGGLTIETWGVNYQLHTTAPVKNGLIEGGFKASADGWIHSNDPIHGTFYCDYLCFLLNENGTRTWLLSLHDIHDMVPGDDAFQAEMLRELNWLGIISPQDAPSYLDHMSLYIDAPPDVQAAAKAQVQENLAHAQECFGNPTAEYDDWRVESLEGPWREEFDGLTVEVWRMDYKLHTTTPDRIGLSGGRYVTEDNWVSPGYPNCDYFYFLLNEDGTRTCLLYLPEINDLTPGTEHFRRQLIWDLQNLNLLPADG